MRGLSSVIVVILFLMIAIALSALGYTFFTIMIQSTTKAGEATLKQTMTSGQSMMKIESVSGDKIYIRNVGQVDLTNISLYVEDTPITYDINKQSIQPGEVAEITITGSAPSGEIKVTTAQGALSIQGNYPGYTPPVDNPPAYSGIATYNPATYSSSTYSWMNITWTDDNGIDWKRIESNFSGPSVNYTPTQSGNVYYLRVILPAGAHRWRSFANDTANQWTTSTTQTFTISKATSTVYLYVDTVRASKSTTVNTIVNYTSQMSTPSSGNVELWTNFSNGVSKRWVGPQASPLVNLTNMTAAGVWNWFANYTGNQNYTADTEAWVVTVT